jgi:glutamate/tyrosine decarboxylase-like PLP-dependent enzyme
VAELFEKCCEHTRELAAGLQALPGVQPISGPVVNQALVRFVDPAPNATEADHDRRTNAVIDAINATGEAFFTGSTWKNRRVMRISVCNWRTDASDIGRALVAVRGVLLSNSFL